MTSNFRKRFAQVRGVTNLGNAIGEARHKRVVPLVFGVTFRFTVVLSERDNANGTGAPR